MSAATAVPGGTRPEAFPVLKDSGVRPPRRARRSPPPEHRFDASCSVTGSTAGTCRTGQARSRYQTRPAPGVVSGTHERARVRPPREGIRRAAGSGAQRLGAVLLAGVALLAGTGSARAQTINPDGSATVWTDTLTVHMGTDWDAGGAGYYGVANQGALNTSSFAFNGTTYRISYMGHRSGIGL